MGKWEDEEPKETGCYWMRYAGHDPVLIKYDAGCVFFFGVEDGEEVSMMLARPCWWGPVPPPK